MIQVFRFPIRGRFGLDSLNLTAILSPGLCFRHACLFLDLVNDECSVSRNARGACQ